MAVEHEDPTITRAPGSNRDVVVTVPVEVRDRDVERPGPGNQRRLRIGRDQEDFARFA